MNSAILSGYDYDVIGLRLFKSNNIPHIIYIVDDALSVANYTKSALEWHKLQLNPQSLVLAIDHKIWLRRVRYEYYRRYDEFLTQHIAIVENPTVVALSPGMVDVLKNFVDTDIKVGFSTTILSTSSIFYLCGSLRLMWQESNNRSSGFDEVL